MTKKCFCLENQIDLVTYQRYKEEQQVKMLKKKSKKIGNIPFCFFIFRKAYVKLKQDGVITRTEILEYQKVVHYEVYEAVYVKALYTVYLQCRSEITDKTLYPILCDMYEKEFGCMKKRFFIKMREIA